MYVCSRGVQVIEAPRVLASGAASYGIEGCGVTTDNLLQLKLECLGWWRLVRVRMFVPVFGCDGQAEIGWSIHSCTHTSLFLYLHDEHLHTGP